MQSFASRIKANSLSDIQDITEEYEEEEITNEQEEQPFCIQESITSDKVIRQNKVKGNTDNSFDEDSSSSTDQCEDNDIDTMLKTASCSAKNCMSIVQHDRKYNDHLKKHGILSTQLKNIEGQEYYMTYMRNNPIDCIKYNHHMGDSDQSF